MNFDELKPGRDTDALVAEICEGYRRERIGKDANGEHGGTEVLVPPTLGDDFYKHLPLKGAVHLGYFAPEYSTNREAAMDFVERLQARGCWVGINTTRDKGLYEVGLEKGGQHEVAIFKPLPLGVAVVALKLFSSSAPPVREIELRPGGGSCVVTKPDGSKERHDYRFGYEDEPPAKARKAVPKGPKGRGR